MLNLIVLRWKLSAAQEVIPFPRFDVWRQKLQSHSEVGGLFFTPSDESIKGIKAFFSKRVTATIIWRQSALTDVTGHQETGQQIVTAAVKHKMEWRVISSCTIIFVWMAKKGRNGREWRESNTLPALIWRCAGWSSAGAVRWRSWCKTARSCCSHSPQSQRCPGLLWRESGGEKKTKTEWEKCDKCPLATL